MSVVVEKHGNDAHGIITEFGRYRAVAFWSRAWDAYNSRYDQWKLLKVVIERQVKDAMGIQSWQADAELVSDDRPSDPVDGWLHGYLRALAASIIAGVL